MWVLVFIAVFPNDGMLMETWGKFDTYEECMMEVREAEIAINATNESMACLEIPPSFYDPEWESVPGDGSLY